MAHQLVGGAPPCASVATAKAVLPQGARAVTAEDNLFDQKSHANPLARLMEIVANSVEHGGASHVALEFRRGFYSVTETNGAGLDYEGLFAAVGRFGGHQAREGTDVKLRHFSHNGIGTKSPMSIFANQLVLSRKGQIHALALLSRGHGPHVLGAQWNSREALARGAAGATSPQMVEQILRRAAPVIPDVFAEFEKIGGSGGCRWCYFTDPNATRPKFRVGDAVEARYDDGYPYAGRVEQVIESVGAADRGRVESYTVKWDDGANPSRVAARDVTPIGGWPEDALEVRDGDVVTRGADLGNDRGMAWTTSFSSRLRLFMAEPRGVTITLNGAAIVPISCEELVDMLEEMPLFEDANGLLTQANEGNPPEQKQEQPIDHPFASGRADPAIYASGSGVSVVGTVGSASSGHGGAGAAVGTARASVMKKGRPAMVYHGANSVSARLRLGRVGFADSQAAAAERSGQRFLDTVYATSGRTEGFKGGFVVFFNGVHIPIPDQLMWLGEAANFNKGGTRLGGRVHGCLELQCLEDSLLSSGKEKLDERHPWFEKCKEWLVFRLNFYLKALSYVDQPDRIRNVSAGKNKEHNEAAMTCARLHIAPTQLSQVEKEVQQRRNDAAAAPDGLILSDLQTAAGARVRKAPQRLETELATAAAEPKRKRARNGGAGGSSPKVTSTALKRSEEANERVKAQLKQAKTRIRELEGQNEQLQGQVEQLQGQVLEQGRLLRLTHSSSSHPPAAGVAATAVRSTGKARTGVIEAPDPRQQPQLLITATRSRPALGNVQGTGTTLAPTDDDEVHSGGSGAGVPVPQPWQPDAITLTIRQWWESLEERLQNALDADDLGVYASRDSRGIGEQQSGREWWVMFSSYSESDMKELFYKEGTVLHDGHTCGRDEVKLRMKDRKILIKEKDALAQRLAQFLLQA